MPQFTRSTVATDSITQLPDKPNISAALLKAKFDAYAVGDKPYINDTLLVELESTTAGSSAAEKLGSAPISNLPGTTVYDQLVSAKSQIDGIVQNPIVIPPGSILRTQLETGVQQQLSYNDKAIAEMEMFLELSGRMPSPNNNKFYTDLINTFTASMGTIDATSQVYTGTLSSGATSVTVTSSTGFAQGQEISIQDGVGYEDVIILSVVGNVITFTTPLVNTYTNPRIYRSNNNGINFGSAGTTAVTYDRTTPVQVVNSAYTTSASARPQVLSNGWIVTVTASISNARLYLHVSKDGGATFNPLCTLFFGYEPYSFAVVSYGNFVYVISQYIDRYRGIKIDATTQSNVTITWDGTGGNQFTIDTSQTAFSGCSIAINPSNGHLTAAWSSKNATYPNSFNIRSAKSTDEGVTWTKQDGTAGVDQITTQNATGRDLKNPVIVYKTNGFPSIISDYTDATNFYIQHSPFNGTVWQGINNYVYSPGAYAQSSPSATVQKYGANVGRIEVAWDGFDSTDTAATNVRYSYSDDNGVTWQTAVKLTSGNTADQKNASVTVDQNGDVHIQFVGNNTGWRWKRLKKTSGVWGSPVDILGVAIGSSYKPSTCDNYYNFEQPLSIVNTSTDVKFYGKWTIGGDTPTTKNVIRMNIRPYLASKYIQAWLTKSEITGFTVDGKASFRTNLTDTETYIDLVETTTDLGSTNEISMSGINATTKPYITLKLILNRASTGDNAQCTRLIGGVSA